MAAWDAVPTHIESTLAPGEQTLFRAMGHTPGAAQRQVLLVLTAVTLAPVTIGLGGSLDWPVGVRAAVFLAVLIGTLLGGRRVQAWWRRVRGRRPDVAVAVAVTTDRVTTVTNLGDRHPMVVRDRPRDELVGIEITSPTSVLVPRGLTRITVRYTDGTADEMAAAGGPTEGLRAGLRMSGIAEVDSDGAPVPARSPHAAAAASPSARGFPVVCILLAVCSTGGALLGALVGHQIDPWARTGFTSEQTSDCATATIPLLADGSVMTELRYDDTIDDELLVIGTEIEPAIGPEYSVRFVCRWDGDQISVTQLD